MTAALALAGLPALALAQGSSGSSMMPQTTQTSPQQGPLSGHPGARAGGVAGQTSGQTVQGDTAGQPQGAAAPDRQTPPHMQSQGQPAGPQSRSAGAPDGTPGNPPSTATQRAADSATGNRTPADGAPGNPPGTAAGRAADRALGTNATGANPAADAGRSTTGAGATTGALAVDSAAIRSGRRASKVIGSSVYNENNESIGEVDDILIPPGGNSPIAVISVGGFLGIGAKLVAVPYERLQAAGGSNNRWTLTGATKDSLGSLPTFSYDNTGERRG
ncbi:PRC-barrel domain-containing protein [Roseicella aerolata]|uniref:PRC-barrel domain-containing protein n=1 Tax=Roseicella aerolata TaxID=2883479 RepID=A0A9X1I9B9_9PROT|nr:PRC-barrel domain-containing protein [Roseicella aerolata]MCB4820302.1 PRC-barrel domain-containing protein [Roseicella aerolata]